MAGLADLGSLAMKAGIPDVTEETGTFRKAGGLKQALQINSNDLDEMLRTWDSYDIDTKQPNYIGRNEQDWIKDNERIRKLLLSKRKDG